VFLALARKVKLMITLRAGFPWDAHVAAAGAHAKSG
jgi:hypothetical protein